MVIDTSAIVAIFNNEPERGEFLDRIQSDRRRLISAGTLIEIQMVLTTLLGEDSLTSLSAFLDRLGVEVVPLDASQAALAVDAFLQFGKGRHKARLNFGDCMAYALAKQTGETLLFKGGDFSETDMRGSDS